MTESKDTQSSAVKPILSICIPTYNRSRWLEATLPIIMPQIQEAKGDVELVISSNASTDNTDEIIADFQKTGPINYNRNKVNIGAEPNMHKLVNELATGTYVWLLGDDDFIRPGTLSKIINTIKENRDLDYFYVNYQSSIFEKAPEKDFTLPSIYEKNPDKHLYNGHEDFSDRRLPSLKEIAGRDKNCFTPISCSIMRRDIASKAIYRDLDLEAFSCPESVVPHAIFIAKNLLNKPAWYFGEPKLLLASDSTWKKQAPAFALNILPDLYDIYQEAGVPEKEIDYLRKEMAIQSGPLFQHMISDRSTPMRNHFSLSRYLKRNQHIPGLRSIILLNYIESKISKFLQNTNRFKLSRFIIHKLYSAKNKLTER